MKSQYIDPALEEYILDAPVRWASVWALQDRFTREYFLTFHRAVSDGQDATLTHAELMALRGAKIAVVLWDGKGHIEAVLETGDTHPRYNGVWFNGPQGPIATLLSAGWTQAVPPKAPPRGYDVVHPWQY